MPGECFIDESSALYKNFLVQITALQLPPLAEEIILAHLHAAKRIGSRARTETPSFQCRKCSIYLRTTGDARTVAARVPPLLIAYRLEESAELGLPLEPVLVDLLSRYEVGDADPLPPEMLDTPLLDFVSATGNAPDSLTLAVEQILDEILGDDGN